MAREKDTTRGPAVRPATSQAEAGATPAPRSITELWAWIVTEPDGGEGIPAVSDILPGHLMPLVGSDEARMRSLESHARRIAGLMGLPVKLMRFSTGEIVDLGGRGAPCAADVVRSYQLLEDGKAIRFLPCGVTSHHPEDARQRYCARCGHTVAEAAGG